MHYCFNSTLVQLKGIRAAKEKKIAQSFNSTLVQLKAMTIFPFSKKPLFQFYLSSIKSRTKENIISEIILFQFYLSSIKRVKKLEKLKH